MISIRAKLLSVFLSSIFVLAAISLLAAFLVNKLAQNAIETKSLSKASEELAVHAGRIINLSVLYQTADAGKQAAVKAEYEFSKKHLGDAVLVLKNSGKFSGEVPFLEKNNQKIILGAEKVIGLADERLKKEKHFSEVLVAGLRENRHKVLDETGSVPEKLRLAAYNVGYKDKEFNFQYQDKAHAEEWTQAIGLLRAELKQEGFQKLLPFADNYSALAKEAISERFAISDLKLQEQYNLELARSASVEINNYSAVISQALGSELESTAEQGGAQRGITFAAILLAVLLGGGAVRLISRNVTAPIEQLVKVARNVSGGDLSQRAVNRTKDEIGYLSEVFNKMLDNIQNSQKQLEAAGEQLQKANREMEEKNEELEKFKRLTEGRELKMMELKKALKVAQDELSELKKKQGT